MVLGVLLTTLFRWQVEAVYVNAMMSKGLIPEAHIFFGFQYYLPTYFGTILFLLGVGGGFYFGRRWWQWVYVEKRHWRFRKK
jgi:hypothetical protein